MNPAGYNVYRIRYPGSCGGKNTLSIFLSMDRVSIDYPLGIVSIHRFRYHRNWQLIEYDIEYYPYREE